MQAAETAPAEMAFRSISHDLRNTLGAILGWVTVLKRAPGASPLVVQGVDAIERNVQLQSTALEDLLDSARLSCGQLVLNFTDIAPGAVARMALDDLSLHAARCGVTLHAAGIDEQSRIRADESRLRRVVAALLRTVIDAMPRGGGVELNARAANDCYEIRVSDTTLSPHAQEHAAAETGLPAPLPNSLALAAQLVRQHHGSLAGATDQRAQSRFFCLRLPVG